MSGPFHVYQLVSHFFAWMFAFPFFWFLCALRAVSISLWLDLSLLVCSEMFVWSACVLIGSYHRHRFKRGAPEKETNTDRPTDRLIDRWTPVSPEVVQSVSAMIMVAMHTQTDCDCQTNPFQFVYSIRATQTNQQANICWDPLCEQTTILVAILSVFTQYSWQVHIELEVFFLPLISSVFC